MYTEKPESMSNGCFVGYGQQQAAAYIQQPQAQHVQVQVPPPSAQPASAYGIAAAQQAYGQPPGVIAAGQPAGAAYGQQLPPGPGQPAGQQTVVYGQPPAQPGIPSYGQPQQAPGYAAPVAQAGAPTAYGQPAPGQTPVYGQPQVSHTLLMKINRFFIVIIVILV